MERIALVTPWPPAFSGIADFAHDLALGLRDAGWAVTVFTHAERPTRVSGVTVNPVPATWNGDGLASFPNRIFQFGNNVQFHSWMLGAAARFPGIVQLHDPVLHHLLVGLTCALDNWVDYQRAFRDWYGSAAAARFAQLPPNHVRIWESDTVIEYPFFEVFLDHAHGVIVHSRYAARMLTQRLPLLPVRQVLQTYRHAPGPKRTKLARIGIFGDVVRHKRLEWILEAFGYLDRTLADVEVTVVGSIGPGCEDLVRQAGLLPHAAVRFTGRLDDDAFAAEMNKTDLCIALRSPTMGETSAVVMRAVQLGIPTIVSDTGWYSELPEQVRKAPLDNTPHFLSSTIEAMLTRPEKFESWATDCADLSQSMRTSHAEMCASITDFVRAYRAEQFAMDVVADRLCKLGFNGDLGEADILRSLEARSAWVTEGTRQ